jgi:hypothetical protein
MESKAVKADKCITDPDGPVGRQSLQHNLVPLNGRESVLYGAHTSNPAASMKQSSDPPVQKKKTAVTSKNKK